MNSTTPTRQQSPMNRIANPTLEETSLSHQAGRKHLPAQSSRAFRNSEKDKAYTLVELLVVMGIVAGAFTVIPSVVIKAKKNGKDVSCRNHLRQVVMGYRLYVSEYRTVPNPGLDVRRQVKPGHAKKRCHRRHPRGKAILRKICGTPDRFAEFKKYRDCLRCHTKFPEFRHATANTSHNRLGYFTHKSGFKPQGLGRLLADGFIGDPSFLYCPSDPVLLADNDIAGVKSSDKNWIFKYPQLGSFITRPFGNTGAKEQTSALETSFFSNSGKSVFLTEISGNHTNGVHHARLNGSVDRVENIPVYARASSAFGARWIPWTHPHHGQDDHVRKHRHVERVREPAYRFHFSMSPWIWLALDNPQKAEHLIARYSKDADEGDNDDHEDVPGDIDIDEEDEDRDDDEEDDHGDHRDGHRDRDDGRERDDDRRDHMDHDDHGDHHDD